MTTRLCIRGTAATRPSARRDLTCRSGSIAVGELHLDPKLAEVARRAMGFMPEGEGIALYEAGRRAARVGPLLEIGTYCGKSAIYLGAAARAEGSVLFTVDHHRGSEEHQEGEAYFDRRLVDRQGQVDTLPAFRQTIDAADLWDAVVAVIGSSSTVARGWVVPLGLVFVDGGHSRDAAHCDFEEWSPKLGAGGLLAIHDVFPDPRDGGRPPFEIYRRALDSGRFKEVDAVGSLRVLERA